MIAPAGLSGRKGGTDAMRRGLRAFTLIEILMAMMVLSIGLASVLSVFWVGVHSSRRVVDKSAAAVTAKAALARVIAQDANADGARDFLKIIKSADANKKDWVWIHSGTVSCWGAAGDLETNIPLPVSVGPNSPYSWRCRASRHYGDIDGKDGLANPVHDMQDATSTTGYAKLSTGRVPRSQVKNPDAEELWRVTVEVFREYRVGEEPLATFDTLVCTAHK